MDGNCQGAAINTCGLSGVNMFSRIHITDFLFAIIQLYMDCRE